MQVGGVSVERRTISQRKGPKALKRAILRREFSQTLGECSSDASLPPMRPLWQIPDELVGQTVAGNAPSKEVRDSFFSMNFLLRSNIAL